MKLVISLLLSTTPLSAGELVRDFFLKSEEAVTETEEGHPIEDFFLKDEEKKPKAPRKTPIRDFFFKEEGECECKEDEEWLNVPCEDCN